MKTGRRQFTGACAALAGTSLGCSEEDGAPRDAGTSGGAPPSDLTDQGGLGGETNDAAPTCGEFTATNIEGPFFLPSSPERTDLAEDNPGPPLDLTGRVLNVQCQPLAGVLVDFWQADVDGAYDTEGNSFRGHQFTDKEGRYSLQSIIPGRYLNGAEYRPAHLHVKVHGQTGVLTTQLYFEGDPYNDVDPFIEESLIMPVRKQDGASACEFDFVLDS